MSSPDCKNSQEKLYFRDYKFPLVYKGGRDVAVLKLDEPFKFDDYVRPACLPPINWTSKRYFEGGIMVASGMGRIDNDHRTTELKLASLQMLTKDECRRYPWVQYYFKGSPLRVNFIEILY